MAKSTSYSIIAKWAKEAKAELAKGNLAAVKTNLSIIYAQAKEEEKWAKNK